MTPTALYEQNAIATQGKGRLIVMLYEGAVKFLKHALNAIENHDYESKGKYIVKAQDIIFELNSVLDMDAGGQIAQNLRKLYNFSWQRLSDANIQNDPQMIQDVIGILSELNKGWKAIADK